MNGDFCTRTAGRIRRLGYPRRESARLAKVCYCLMLFLCGLMGPLEVPSAARHLLNRGHGKDPQSARALLKSLSFPGQRRLPAL